MAIKKKKRRISFSKHGDAFQEELDLSELGATLLLLLQISNKCISLVTFKNILWNPLGNNKNIIAINLKSVL